MTSVADVTFALLREAWSALGGGTDLLALVDLTGDGAGLLPSTPPAMVAAVSVSTLAASVLDAARRARPPASILIDAEHVAVAAATLTDAGAQYAPTGRRGDDRQTTRPTSSPLSPANPSNIKTSTAKPGSNPASPPVFPPTTPTCSGYSPRPSPLATALARTMMSKASPRHRQPASPTSSDAPRNPGLDTDSTDESPIR
jgi:hypothetical protein